MRHSEMVDEAFAERLHCAIERGDFPGISFQHAMEFVLSDGIIPASDLPVESVLALDDWLRAGACRHND